jgi:hypothetical protein
MFVTASYYPERRLAIPSARLGDRLGTVRGVFFIFRKMVRMLRQWRTKKRHRG